MSLSLKLSLTFIVITCLCGCNTMVVKDEPFFASVAMQDTLDNYMSNIDYSLGEPSRPLVTYIIIHDMWELGHPVLLLLTSKNSEVFFPSIDKDLSRRYYGKYRGELVEISFNPKYSCYFKRRIKQSKEAEKVYREARGQMISSLDVDVNEGYVEYDIMRDGSLKCLRYQKSVYEKGPK